LLSGVLKNITDSNTEVDQTKR